MIGEAAAAKLHPIPLSDNTVARRISDMALDVKDQVIDAIKESKVFALQIDESTDVASCAQVLVYVRYRECLDIKEEFLFCRPLPARATGEEMFTIMNDFMRENDIDWTRCCGICSDGARAMTGRRSGLITRIQQVAPAAVWSHCIIHRQALAAKKMPEQLRTVLNEAVLIVNFIKARALNSCLFSILCEEMGAHYRGLLLHTEVRWLSRGKVLTRLCELREEILLFLADAKSPLLRHMEDMTWVAKLAYLADIFDRMNMLNASLQGKECNVFVANERVTAFRNKLDLWATRVDQGSLEMFSTVEDVMTRADLPLDTILPVISEHLRGMCRQFGEHFTEDTVKHEWIRNPFLFNPTPSDGLSIHEKEALADLTADRELQQKITRVSIGSFWLSVENEYQTLTEKAMVKLTPSSSTYMCESGFSALTYIKNKYRSRLAVEDDLRLFLSTQQPRISRLCAQRAQHHPSH
ncbi:zinc finger BED domain-containing protein 5-like [Odontesthes bonariensis]|uniref:zinc finger BED domain-containing protein 5-like n=1 Tax=Odontesthes bonariensis TaxID=219752 RepID=UPI003F58A236